MFLYLFLDVNLVFLGANTSQTVTGTPQSDHNKTYGDKHIPASGTVAGIWTFWMIHENE